MRRIVLRVVDYDDPGGGGGQVAETCRPRNVTNTQTCTHGREGHVEPTLRSVLDSVDPGLWHSPNSEDRQLLLDEITRLIDFWLAFRRNEGLEQSQNHCPLDPEVQGDTAFTAVNDANGPASSYEANRHGSERRSKRGRSGRANDDNDGDEGDGDGDGDGSKRQRTSATQVLRFACPFLKRFPLMFSNNKHCLGGWPNVHRLKLVLPRVYTPSAHPGNLSQHTV